MPDLLPLLFLFGSFAAFFIVMRRFPRRWPLDAIDRLARQNPAWARYGERVREAEAAVARAATPEERATREAELAGLRHAAAVQVQAQLMWQRIPRAGWAAAGDDRRRQSEIAEDVGASLVLDRALLTDADLELRSRLLERMGPPAGEHLAADRAELAARRETGSGQVPGA